MEPVLEIQVRRWRLTADIPGRHEDPVRRRSVSERISSEREERETSVLHIRVQIERERGESPVIMEIGGVAWIHLELASSRSL